MLAAGPAPRHYDPTVKPVMRLLSELAARRDLPHVSRAEGRDSNWSCAGTRAAAA